MPRPAGGCPFVQCNGAFPSDEVNGCRHAAENGILSHVKLLAIAWLAAVPLFAGSTVSLGLDVSAFADTESSTNVHLAAWEKNLCRFEFSLSFLATPSNNVQVSLGVDEDCDGILSAHEERMTVGWDCGTWFARAARTSISSTSASQGGRKTLRCVFATYSDGRLKSFLSTGGRRYVAYWHDANAGQCVCNWCTASLYP